MFANVKHCQSCLLPRSPPTNGDDDAEDGAATSNPSKKATQNSNRKRKLGAGRWKHVCARIRRRKRKATGTLGKCDVAFGDAEQQPGPTAKDVTPTQEPTSYIDEVIDIDSEEYASAAGTDDEPQ